MVKALLLLNILFENLKSRLESWQGRWVRCLYLCPPLVLHHTPSLLSATAGVMVYTNAQQNNIKKTSPGNTNRSHFGSRYSLGCCRHAGLLRSHPSELQLRRSCIPGGMLAVHIEYIVKQPGACNLNCRTTNVSCGVRAHAQLPAVDLKSTPLTTRAN